MRAAHRLRGLGWLLSCVVVVLGLYMVSLSVAAERSKLDKVNARIERAQRELRTLETEFDTRANLAQLERWNGDVLSLTAPTTAQFVPSEQAFAAMVRRADGGPHVELAALIVPAGVDPAQAVAAATAPVASAAVQRDAVAQEAPVVQVAAAAGGEAAATRKAQAVAMLDRKLLSDSTLGDLISGARAEAAKLR